MTELIIKGNGDPRGPTKLEQQVKEILLRAGVKPNDIDDCVSWAFGKDAWHLSPAEWVDRWNYLHPTAVQISPRDKFTEAIFVVGFFYVQQRAKAAQQKGRR